MKAIVYHRYGSPECEEIEKPTAEDNEVLIKAITLTIGLLVQWRFIVNYDSAKVRLAMTNNPWHVEWFVLLSCLSLAIGALKVPMDWNYLTTIGPISSVLFIMVSTVGIIALLIWKISQRRKWARITLLILFVLGMLPFTSTVRSEFARSTTLGALSIVQALLQGASLVLLFTRTTNEWFRTAPASN